MKFRIIDVFSGIGGMALGFQRAGERENINIEIVAFCEKEPKARQILKKNYPGCKIFKEIKTLSNDLKESGIIGGKKEPTEPIDIMVGGFP